MAKVKVYGGMAQLRGKQVRCIVATTSKAKVVELTNLSQSYVRDYWTETRNPVEVKAAMQHVGEVLVKPEPHGDVFLVKNSIWT